MNKIKRNRIFIDDWLIIKPYEKQVPSDSYYLSLCNKVKNRIADAPALSITPLNNEDDLNSLCCFLVSYLEDFISDAGIWSSFVNKHLELYKKPLPFYNLDDYYTDDINLQDISFLIWYFIHCIQEGMFIKPTSLLIVETAEKVYNLFEEEFDNAPVNDSLKSFYQVEETETDYYEVRAIIQNLLFRSYLFHFDTGLILHALQEETIEKYEKDENLLSYLNDNLDSATHSFCTKLLSLRGNEWAAIHCGRQHQLYNDLNQISPKVQGYFQYKGQNDTHIFLQHIATEKMFEMTKESYDKTDSFLIVDDLFYLGLVKWRNEWWFTGHLFGTGFDADLILDEKNSIESRKALDFLIPVEETSRELQRQKKVFLEFNGNSLIAFFPADKINDFINEFMAYYNDSLKLTDELIEESKKRLRSKGFFGGPPHKLIGFSPETKSGLVFFNPDSGLEVVFNINSAFPDKKNPYYNKKDADDHFKHLLFSRELSTGLIQHCVNTHRGQFKNNEFITNYSDDWDFLLRFLKVDHYHATPSITLV